MPSKIMAREAPADIIEFEHMGVIFYRNEDGRLGRRAFGGASLARTYFVGDITGQALLVTLYDQILKAGVKVYEEWFATAVHMEDGECRGLVALEMVTGELHLLRAKGRHLCKRRPRAALRTEYQRADLHRRRLFARLSRRRAVDGHGDGAVPSRRRLPAADSS